jgi:hypothetical protein
MKQFFETIPGIGSTFNKIKKRTNLNNEGNK